MNPINLFLVTFNCGKKEPLDSLFINSIKGKIPSNLSNLYIFGFQEISSLLNSTDDALIYKYLVIISNNLIECLSQKFKHTTFELISINNFGSIGLIIISPFKEKISNITNLAGYPVGHLLTNLKGGIGIELNYENLKLSFICMHLNAGHTLSRLLKRNDDLKNILSNLLENNTDANNANKHNNHCFLMGDFNYRTSGAYHFSKSSTHLEVAEKAIIEDQLVQEDELLILKKNNIILQDFSESKITFKPTYKFIVGTPKYNPKRKPSYCDRILFNNSKSYEVVEYNSIDNCFISDHIPVYLVINIGPGIKTSSKLNLPVKYNHSESLDYVRKVSHFTTGILRLILLLTTTFKGRLILIFLFASLIYLLFK